MPESSTYRVSTEWGSLRDEVYFATQADMRLAA